MNEPTLLDYVTAIGAIATPILILILSGVGWRFRKRLERRVELEDMLREDRIQVYNHILEPFVIMLMPENAWKADPKNKGKHKNEVATQKVLTIEYRQAATKLSLFGADAVVKAYNNLMQHFYEKDEASEKITPDDPKKAVELLGRFLLEIRRSVGNEATALDHWDMLEWFVVDARKYRKS